MMPFEFGPGVDFRQCLRAIWDFQGSVWLGGLRLKYRELHWFGLGRLQRMLVNRCPALFLDGTSSYHEIEFDYAFVVLIRVYLE